MKLNYAVLQPAGKITFKQEAHKSSYDTLKDEVDGILDVRQLDNLDIWFDDEFLLHGRPEPTLIIKNSKGPNLTDYDLVLCGNVVFASHDGGGNTISLTEKATEQLKKFRPAFLGLEPILIYKNY